MPNGFSFQPPIPPVRGALSGQPGMPSPQAPAVAPGMPSGSAVPPMLSANPLPQGGLPPPSQAPMAPGATPYGAPMMASPMMAPQGQPMLGSAPAAPAGPSSMLSSADTLISRILGLMQPPQAAQQPPAMPPGGAPQAGPQGDQMAQILKLLAASRQAGPPQNDQRLGMARGGYPFDYLSTRPGLPLRNAYAMGGPAFGPIGSPYMYARGDYVAPDGMGDGRSDHVPAKLSPGEFVMDAETVSLLGNGDNDAGARRLEQMRQNLRKSKGEALAKGKFSPDAKAPESYLPKKPRV